MGTRNTYCTWFVFPERKSFISYMLSGCNSLLSNSCRLKTSTPQMSKRQTKLKTCQACAPGRAGTGTRKRQTKLWKNRSKKMMKLWKNVIFRLRENKRMTQARKEDKEKVGSIRSHLKNITSCDVHLGVLKCFRRVKCYCSSSDKCHKLSVTCRHVRQVSQVECDL